MVKAWLPVILLLLAACRGEPEGLLVNLENCTVDDIPFDEALRWDAADIDFDSERYRRFERLVAKSAPFGVYYGICGIDSSHGQSMQVRFPGPAGNAGPAARTRPVLHPDGSLGRAGAWSTICPGFEVKFTLDADDRLTALLVSPLDRP